MTESEPIILQPNDPLYQAHNGSIDFHRCSYDPATGTNSSNPRQQVNGASSWLDGQAMYQKHLNSFLTGLDTVRMMILLLI